MYSLKISLSEIEPQIWRRFTVPAGITLDRLHDIIQIIMGWEDSHLHQFSIGKKRYTENPEFREDGLEEANYRLGDLVKQKNRVFGYLYDFGDRWEHEIVLENNRYSSPQSDIECLEGANACPPEDVGGVPGYYGFCDAMINPKHKGHGSYMEWYGGVYHPKQFDVEAVNWELSKYLRWSRDRLKSWRDDGW
jgi:hypothetical protein